MATTLASVVRFTAVAAAGQSTLPHDLNISGTAKIPDLVLKSNGSFSVVATTATTITVQNDGALAADCDVWCEIRHSMMRAYDPLTDTSLTPRPFVAAGGATGSASSSNLIVWTVGKTWVDTYAEIVAADGPVICLVEYDPLGARSMTANGGVATNLYDVQFVAIQPFGADLSESPQGVSIAVADTFTLGVDPDENIALLYSKDIVWVFDTTTNPAVDGVRLGVYLDGGGVSHTGGDYGFDNVVDFIGEFSNNAEITGAGGVNLFRLADPVNIMVRTSALIGPDSFGTLVELGDSTVTVDGSAQISATAFSGTTAVLTRLDTAIYTIYNDDLETPLLGATNVQAAIDALKVGFRTAFNISKVTSSDAEAALGNGVTYWPFVKAGNDTVQFQCAIGAQSGDYALRFLYYMAASNAGNVQWRIDKRINGLNADPTVALTVGTPFVSTPGANTNQQLVSNAQSADLAFTCALNDVVTILITRVDGAPDTHTGDARILAIQLVPIAA